MDEIENLLDELKYEIENITNINDKNKRIVLGAGKKDGDILFIGDDSNLYLDENFRVTTGSSGEFLIRLCDIIGLLPDNYYITTLTKSNEKFREYDEKDKENLKEYLFMQIALINPKIIVAFGVDVAELLLDKEIKFSDEVGKVKLWKGDIKILVTYDVNFAKKSRDDGGKRAKIAMDFWNDLKTVKSVMEES